jgi:hypothetical protein
MKVRRSACGNKENKKARTSAGWSTDIAVGEGNGGLR